MILSTFTYCLIALFFGGLMVISLIFGGHDVEIDHDMDAHAEGGDSGWSAWFSLKVISAFCTGFGACGAIASVNQPTKPWALLIAIGSGFVIALLVKTIISYLKSQESTASFSRDQLLGKTGTMILGASGSDIGEAQFIVDGQMVSIPARSGNGAVLMNGDSVTVDSCGAVISVVKVG